MRLFMILCFTALLAGAGPATKPVEKPILPIQTVALPGVEGPMDHLCLDRQASRLFIASLGKNAVYIMDLKIGRMAMQMSGLPKPQGIALAPDIERVAITCEADGGCRLIGRAKLNVLSLVSLGTDADNVRYEPVAKCFWVGFGNGGLAVLDPVALKTVTEIKLESHPESFQFESKGKRVFVNLPLSGYIAVIDREKYEITAKWRPDGAAAFYPMALDEEHHRLFIGCRKPAKVLVLDLDTGKTITSIDCVADTDDLYYDSTARQIYVTGGGGTITILKQTDADHYAPIRNIPTGDGARTSVLDPETGWLYVAVPHRDKQRAEIKVFDMRGMP